VSYRHNPARERFRPTRSEPPPDDAYDLIFLDAERDAYPSYWPDLVRMLTKPAGLLAVDNVISHAAEVAEFRSIVESDERVTAALVPIGAGVLLVALSPG
jgi:predicted O-methyltransferase YrrM